MIEAELKYFVRDPDALRSALTEYASTRHLIYNDQYFSHPSLDFQSRDAEFRVRSISEKSVHVRTILTYKSDIADSATQSKSEYEVDIASSQHETRTLLEAMGFICYIEFEKICEHFEFKVDSHRVGATIVSLNEVADTFVEIESLVSDGNELHAELEWLRGLSAKLGLPESDQTVVTYEGMVAEARDQRPTA